MPSSTPAVAVAPAGRAGEPSLPALVLIFWAAFAAAAAALQLANPEVFARVDPDSVLRLVQVRDLIAGQGWRDLVQHRMDPPAGTLMHWSRLIDAPLAGLVLLGNALSFDGEAVALTIWPLILLLAAMAGTVYAAVALAGRASALPALLMSLTFYRPLEAFVPGSIDHHNAQIALALATLACALRLRQAPLLGAAAGLGAALMLAIGLETLVYVAIFGISIATIWAVTGEGGRGSAYFGAAFALAPAALYLLTGSPAAATACDSLSWTYAAPAAVAGAGLAALAMLGQRLGRPPMRLLALAALAGLAGSMFLLIAPECRAGPYGFLSPELGALFLRTVAEAQPLLATFPADPAGAVASVLGPSFALAIALRRAWAGPAGARHRWVLPAALIAAALVLSLYQLRAVPYAQAFAVPVLAAWVAELGVRRAVSSLRPIRRAWPVLAAFLLALPVVHLGIGLAAVRTLALASDGRIAPAELRAVTKPAAGLTFAQQECIDGAAAAHFAQAPTGLVLAPLFYGSSVLALSPHAVVAGPYHRAEAAVLDTIRAMNAAPEEALAIVRARGVDLIAICTSAEEVRLSAAEAPGGLLARLRAGDSVDWLTPVPPSPDSALRLYRVRDPAP